MSRSDAHPRYLRDVAQPAELDPRIVEAMVHECARVGLCGITDDNWPEFAARSRLWRRLMGKTELAPEDVRRFVGLTSDGHDEDVATWSARLAEDAIATWAAEMRAAHEHQD
jgi:hypothetical protein